MKIICIFYQPIHSSRIFNQWLIKYANFAIDPMLYLLQFESLEISFQVNQAVHPCFFASNGKLNTS